MKQRGLPKFTAEKITLVIVDFHPRKIPQIFKRELPKFTAENLRKPSDLGLFHIYSQKISFVIVDFHPRKILKT
jgi:hypothetical protein